MLLQPVRAVRLVMNWFEQTRRAVGGGCFRRYTDLGRCRNPFQEVGMRRGEVALEKLNRAQAERAHYARAMAGYIA